MMEELIAKLWEDTVEDAKKLEALASEIPEVLADNPEKAMLDIAELIDTAQEVSEQCRQLAKIQSKYS